MELLEARQAPSASPWLLESFDTTAPGGLPAGWARWSSSGTAPIGVSSSLAFTAPNGLAFTAPASNVSGRAWYTTPLPADSQVSADLFVTSLIPAQVLVRGSSLNTATPSYYALAVTRGLQLQLVRVVNGVSTTLGQVTSVRWFDDQWVQTTLSVNGSSLRAQLYRPDTSQYLNGSGQWQTAQAWALDLTDAALTGGGLAGLGQRASYTGTITFDDFTVVLPDTTEHFDTTAAGALPANWSQWSSSGKPSFAVSAAQSLSAPNSLAVTAPASNLAARAWDNDPQQADVQVSAAVYLNSLIPAQVLARGTGLNTAAPSYYAAQVTRGLNLALVRVVNGVSTTLAQLNSGKWFDGQWARVTLYVNGTNLRAQVFRPDTAQYLNASGAWQSTPAWALNLTDTALSGGGLAGLARTASYVGAIYFDDFLVTSAAGDNQPPTVAVTAPAPGATLSGLVTVQASASDNVGVTKVEFYLDGVLRAVDLAAPYQWDFDTTTASNGAHAVQVLAYDAAGNVGRATLNVTTSNNTVLPRPTIPQHYPNIRIAEVAYAGTPFGPAESQLLTGSVDLVITDPQVSGQIQALAPGTPQLVYTNTSSVYLNLLTDWLNYADAHGLAREGAFYHVGQATPFSGNSPSSQPVTWFWGVYRVGTSVSDATAAAHGSTAGAGVAFGAAGESLAAGYPDEFREINLSLASGASGGWSAVLEYPTAVDAAGNPTAWAPLTTLTNTTAGLGHSGQITFDPPANWKPASVGGSARLYYVRFRTTAGGQAPVASTILGNDYAQANGGTSGIIPAFDSSADTDHDGYLNDAEYARRRPGMDARFLYQSRDFAAGYGQMRFATNPANQGFKAWAVDYETRFVQGLPGASGLFMDNASGSPLVNGADVLEPVASYASDYAALLNAIGQAIAPHWLLANTAGNSATAATVIQKIQGYFEEFAIRPLASNYLQFEDLAAQTAAWAALTSPAPYAVLDSLPTGGSPTDPRTELATLAYYYLLADPSTTFLDFFGGFETNTSWTRHWVPAAAYNVGQPVGSWSLFASGSDPASPALTYHVYQRSYTNALVLYKPLSYGNNVTGTLADATATTHALGGTYRLLQADGSLGPPITSITLRNGEGAILVKAGS
jgi:hypothetical protein